MSKLRALVRKPSPKMAQGEITRIRRSNDVDYAKGIAQWENYVKTLEEIGWETVIVDSVEDAPDQVFIEDTMFVYEDLAVISHPGVESRRGEMTAAERAVRNCGYRVKHIVSPGTIDGGDVLKFGGKVWVGLTEDGRTNEDGVEQLREHISEFDVEVIPVSCSKLLHLKSGITAIYDGTVIGYLPTTDDPEVWEKFLPVPEFLGSQVLLMENNTILMSAAAPKTKQLLEDLGYKVVAVDISEFEKMEGSVTCMSVRLRGHVEA